jgi:NADH-quinone oxidoreductase subunit I
MAHGHGEDTRDKRDFRDTLWYKLYIPEIIRGLKVTLKHLLFHPRFTIKYPEEKYSCPGFEGSAPGYHGEHRLKPDESGKAKCVACFMCQTVCPAEAIEIQAGEDEKGNKVPLTFEINMLRCIYCGFCEEACPKDAIELTTRYYTVSTSREEKIYDKEKLLG